MTYLLYFHRLMFAAALFISFMAGAINAGKEDMLRDLLSRHIVQLSMGQLSEMAVN